jgi:dihydroxyacetone kinase phosphoprotein-dependent L subunit
MLSVLNEDNVRNMIIYIADKIIENKPLLTELDSKIGDGDHGIGMAVGMQKAKDAVSGENTGNAYALFEKAGKAMLMSMGGASGVIFSSMFMAGAKGLKAGELAPQDIAAMMEKGLVAVKDRGKAQVGDKTMVDALEPAVEAIKKTSASGFSVMLKAATEAAAEGMENTKKYQAIFGRAKSLMERAIGHQDPGAATVWLIFRSMFEFIEQEF